MRMKPRKSKLKEIYFYLLCGFLVLITSGCEFTVTLPEKNSEEAVKVIPYDAFADANAKSLDDEIKKSLNELFVLMDSEQDDVIWKNSSDGLKKITDYNEFKPMFASIHSLLGKPIQRQLSVYKFTDKIENAKGKSLEGKFFAAIFNSNFEKKLVVEKIIFVFEGGNWKLFGYHFESK